MQTETYEYSYQSENMSVWGLAFLQCVSFELLMNAMALGTCQLPTANLQLPPATCRLPPAAEHKNNCIQIVGQVTRATAGSKVTQTQKEREWVGALLLFRYSLPNAIVSFVIPDGSPRCDDGGQSGGNCKLMKLICHRMWHHQPPQSNSLFLFPHCFSFSVCPFLLLPLYFSQHSVVVQLWTGL